MFKQAARPGVKFSTVKFLPLWLMNPWLAQALRPGHGDRTSPGPGAVHWVKRGSIGLTVVCGAATGEGEASRCCKTHGYAFASCDAAESKISFEVAML